MTDRPRWPWVVIVVAVVLTAAAAWRVTTLRPETSLDGLLNPNDPATAAMGRVMANFPLAEEMLVLVSLPDVDGDAAKLPEFAERLHAALADRSLVTATRWRAGESARNFVTEVMAPAGLLYLSDDQLAAAEARLTPAGMREQLARSAALLAAPGPAAGGLAKATAQDPLRLHEFLLASMKTAGLPASGMTGGDAFFTADGRGLLIRIEGAKPPGDLAFSATLTDAVRTVANRVNTGGLTVKLSGAYAIAAHNAAAIRRDSIESCAVSTVALAALFGLLYRRPLRTFAMAFMPVAMGLVWGFGAYAVLRDTITPLAAVIGGVLGGVGIDYPVHLMAHRRENETPVGTTRRLFAPLLAAYATSAVGFAAVAWSPLRVLRDFALIGSLGLAGAWTATMLLLPAIMTLTNDRGAGFAAARGRPAAKLWPLVAWRPAALARGGFIVVCVTAIAAMCVGRGLHEDADLSGLHPRPNPPLDTLAEIDRRMATGGGSYVLHLIAADDDALLRLAWHTRHALKGEAISTFGPASLLPDPDAAARRMSAPRDVDRVVADFRAAVADSDFGDHAFDGYAGFLPKLLRPTHAPTLADLRRYPDLAQTMLPRRATPGMAEATMAVFPKREPTTPAEVAALVDTIRRRVGDTAGVTLTGMAVLGNDTRADVRRDALRIAGTALVAVTFILLLHLRSLRLAVLTVLPTLFSFACVLLVMRAFGFGVNVVNLVMFPLLLGITVDYGIFGTDVLRPGVTDRATERFLAATTALLACVATTFIGFGSLVTTAVPAVRSLGWLINVGLAACVVSALFVLWPIVLRIAARRGRL